MRVWLIVVVWILMACTPAPPGASPTEGSPTPPAPGTAQVELSIFSGRPNPTWALTESEYITFLGRIATLSEQEPQPMVEGLGYQGFSVHVAALAEMPQSYVQVRGGQVRIVRWNEAHFYGDPGQDLERWLLETGSDDLEPALYEMVLQQLPQEQ